MNRKTLTHRASLIGASITIISAILLLFCFNSYFDAEAGYFTKGALPTIFGIFYIAGLILPLTITLMINKKQIIKTENKIGNIKISFLILAAALAVCAVSFNLILIDSVTIPLVIGICSFAIYIILCSANNGYNASPLKILFVYLSAIIPISMIIYNSSDYTRHSNSVENTLTTVFGLSFMIYILYEAKRIHEGCHSRWHLGAMLLTLHTGATLSIAYIIAYFTKSVYEKPRFLQMITILFVTLIIGLELFRFLREAEFTTKEEQNNTDTPNESAPEQT